MCPADPAGRIAPPIPSSGEESTRDLLSKAQGGDHDALEILCRRYYPRLRRWASGRLPSYARELLDTDDLIQESFFRTLQRLRYLHPSHGLALEKYFHRAILNQIRRQATRSKRRCLMDGIPEPEVQGPSPLEEALGHAAVRRYELAMSKLSSLDQEILICRIELGCSYREVAEMLGKPTADAARVAVARALVRLGKEMTNA